MEAMEQQAQQDGLAQVSLDLQEVEVLDQQDGLDQVLLDLREVEVLDQQDGLDRALLVQLVLLVQLDIQDLPEVAVQVQVVEMLA
jgi:hypothetical protein